MSDEQISFFKYSSLKEAMSGLSVDVQGILTGSFDRSEIQQKYILDMYNDNFKRSQLQPSDISNVLSDALETSRSRHAEVTEQDSDTEKLEKILDEATEKYRPIFRARLLGQINDAHFEYGFKSEVDDYLAEAFKQYGPLSRQWLEELFNEQFESPYTLCGILRTIAHFKYRDLYPQGMTIATAAFSHNDPEVRECGIRCFENWEEPEALNILRNVSIPEEWLREYLEEVIIYLEEIKAYAIAG